MAMDQDRAKITAKQFRDYAAECRRMARNVSEKRSRGVDADRRRLDYLRRGGRARAQAQSQLNFTLIAAQQ
jgi:hypothetical protein